MGLIGWQAGYLLGMGLVFHQIVSNNNKGQHLGSGRINLAEMKSCTRAEHPALRPEKEVFQRRSLLRSGAAELFLETADGRMPGKTDGLDHFFLQFISFLPRSVDDYDAAK